MENLKAGDLMIPLRDYAVVSEDATMSQAICALDVAQRNLTPDRHRHRAVLVKDRNSRIVGKVGHFAFLKGLEPNYGRLGDWDAVSRAGLSRDFIPTLMASLELWSQDDEDLRERAKAARVKDFMRPVTISVDEGAHLTEAIHLFVIHQTLSVLVKRGDEFVGVLRLADVFQEVFDRLTECAEDGDAPADAGQQ